jgi:hypothetical protein
VRFAETAARQPAAQLPKQLPDRQANDDTRGDEAHHSLVNEKPSIDHPVLYGEAQRRQVPVPRGLALCEHEPDPLPVDGYDEVQPLHPAGLPTGEPASTGCTSLHDALGEACPHDGQGRPPEHVEETTIPQLDVRTS